MKQSVRQNGKTGLKYLLYVPEENEYDDKRRRPVLFFLHGVGERGTDIQIVKRHGPPKIVEEGGKFPFIVISPQCPPSSFWKHDDILQGLEGLYNIAINDLNGDEERVYLTGLSMGGFGTWAWAARSPEKFAAIVPICGGGKSLMAKALVKTPVWAFHGEKDRVVPRRLSSDMVEAVNQEGGNAKLTIYEDLEHDSWTQTYERRDVYEWLLKHSKKIRA